MDSGEIIILVAALVGGLAAALYFLRHRSKRGGRVSVGFRKRTAALGFKAEEIRLLERVATDVAPDNPGDLLASMEGRQLLLRSLERQLRRDERRVESAVRRATSWSAWARSKPCAMVWPAVQIPFARANVPDSLGGVTDTLKEAV